MNNRMNKRKIQSVILAGLLLISLLVPYGCAKKPVVSTTTEYQPYTAAEEIQGVIREMDLDAGTMTFVSVTADRTYELLYNNGVNVTNKYGDPMAATSLELGQIVNVTYNTENKKILDIGLDSSAWEIRDISGFKVDRNKHATTILNHSYSFDDTLVVSSDNELITLGEVCREDLVIARGVANKLCSITVDLGHGYVKLEDYDTYIGGMVEIGYDTIVPVTEDMLLTVREGTYKLKITKGEHSGYKNVVVERDRECTVSLQELQISPDPVGEVFFDLTPPEARVMIDGETIDTAEPISLTYGKHQIKITAEGYETKEGYITIKNAYKIYTIELSSATAEEASTESTTSVSTEATTAAATTESTVTSSAKKTNNTVKIEGPTGAYCYVDGDLKGTVPCTFEKTTGSHIVTFSMTGCLVKSYTIDCQDNGKDDTFTFDKLQTYDSVLYEEKDSQ